MAPLEPRDVERRIRFGGPRTRAPYEAALLNISALSFGAISESALRALSTGAKEAGCYCNSGEGGLHPALLDGGGDLVWQVGSAYFGCRRADGRFDADRFAATAGLPAVKMIELKLSQGAKPGHGGVLPAHKVTLAVAQACGIQPYHDSLCPARHAEFQTPAEMLAFIDRLRALSGGKPVGVKLAVGHPAEVVALVRAMFETDLAPDYVAIDGGEGGSGAAPAEFIGRLALPLLDALWVIHNVLRAAGLRDRVQVVGSGQIAMGSDMVRAFALGADVCAAARAFMLALGCIQAMACQTDRCPTGIATQNRYLSGGLVSETKAFAVARYQSATVESCTGLMAAMGRSHPRRLGPADLYDPRDESECCLFEAEGAFLRGEARSRGLQAAWESSRV
jgi:glutamate synthase domain-containing protein 2